MSERPPISPAAPRAALEPEAGAPPAEEAPDRPHALVLLSATPSINIIPDFDDRAPGGESMATAMKKRRCWNLRDRCGEDQGGSIFRQRSKLPRIRRDAASWGGAVIDVPN